MKNTFITITFVLLSLVSFSQPKYYSPNYYCDYLLDSLQIPYLPIDLRVSGKGFSESYKEKFIKTFGNDLQYIPVHLESDIPIEIGRAHV